MRALADVPIRFQELPEFDRDQLASLGGVPRLFELRTPAILRGLASGWRFMRTWSEDYLADLLGDLRCTVVRDSRPDLARETYSVATYFREYADLDMMTIYGLEQDAERRLFQDIPFPNPCFRRESLSACFFFHAHVNGGSLPHCHEDAFNLLQRGSKRWVMYDADPVFSRRGHDLLRTTLERYGEGGLVRDWFAESTDDLRAANIPVWEGIQRAGDVVYVPVRYAHAAINLDRTLGIVAVVSRPGDAYLPGPDGKYVLPGIPEDAR